MAQVHHRCGGECCERRPVRHDRLYRGLSPDIGQVAPGGAAARRRDVAPGPYRYLGKELSDPLRNCGNDPYAKPTTFVPCLRGAYTFTFSNGVITPQLPRPADHGLFYSPNTDQLTIDTGNDQLFVVVIREAGGTWQRSMNYQTNNRKGWDPATLYEIVVTYWDPTDPTNQTVNRRDVAVPFSWAEIMDQTLYQARR